jgi:hypothetical protein
MVGISKNAATKGENRGDKKSAQSRESLLTPLMRRARNIGNEFPGCKDFFMRDPVKK